MKGGACIDCNLCVAVCPTGIDIRKGQQEGCITCGLCIDACDSIMDKIKQPRGLVRYASYKELHKGKARASFFKRPRVIIYSLIMLFSISGIVYGFTHFSETEFKVVHERQPLFIKMKITDKYLQALKSMNDWVIVSDWAKRFGELYPDLLAKAELEAPNQANDTTGLRELAARISSAISRGAYDQQIEIDTSEKPRRVRYVPEHERSVHESHEIEQDIAPLRRDEIIKLALDKMSVHDTYRIDEFETISKQLKLFFGLDFEVDHATALLNQSKTGKHHPDNFQLLLKAHNARKNNNNWQRFSIDEQIDYIKAAIKLQKLVAKKFDIEMEITVLDSLIERLKNVF